jgi:hypothetical protein
MSGSDDRERVLVAIEVLLERLAIDVVARLREGERETYDSERLPPRCRSRRRFARICRQIPEAYLEGRSWVCPRDVWDAARCRKRAEQPPAVSASVRPANLAGRADALLRRAGLRVVRGSE